MKKKNEMNDKRFKIKKWNGEEVSLKYEGKILFVLLFESRSETKNI